MSARDLVEAALRHAGIGGRRGAARRQGDERHRADPWRPQAWTQRVPPAEGALASRTPFGDGLTLFHDCPVADMQLSQVPVSGGTAPYGIRLNVGRFDGSYLSLVADLPGYAARSVRATDIVVADIGLHATDAPRVFARLNIRHGPNLEQIVRTLPPAGGAARGEFDLGISALEHHAITALWLDLIFETPAHLELTVLDLALSSHPRALF